MAAHEVRILVGITRPRNVRPSGCRSREKEGGEQAARETFGALSYLEKIDIVADRARDAHCCSRRRFRMHRGGLACGLRDRLRLWIRRILLRGLMFPGHPHLPASA